MGINCGMTNDQLFDEGISSVLGQRRGTQQFRTGAHNKITSALQGEHTRKISEH